jgi:hypothetical protein
MPIPNDGSSNEILLKHALSKLDVTSVFGEDEIQGIVETVLENTDVQEQIQVLMDFLDIPLEDARRVLEKIHNNGDDSSEASSERSDRESLDDNHNDDSSNNSNDDCQYILDGECELCERDLKITKHHLIPRETWKYMKPRFISAGSFFLSGEMEKALQILDIGDTFPPGLQDRHFESPLQVKLFLAGSTSDLCSQCHRYIHECFSNKDLAEKYNTVDKLLKDERIYKYCKWANKQRAGKSSKRFMS